jgi:indole-3-glycerol phosphate synthase
MSLLAQILASKRLEIEALRSSIPASASASRPRTLDVVGALRRGPGDRLRIVAEIKKKSPSAGELSREPDVGARAVAYGRGGAAMVSVLCDGPFFGGGWSDLSRAREAVDELSATASVPLLAKEFVLDESQLDRARRAGADAVLLIARIVSPGRLGELYQAARARGLEPVVEVVTETELASALACDARVIGVNARDLDTLAMDAGRTARLLDAIPPTVVRIHLSGIKSEDDVRAVARRPVDAVLMGEFLMREADPEPRLRSLVAAAAG